MGGVLCDIAAMILSTERDHFGKYADAGKLGDPGVLEQILPASLIRAQRRPFLVKGVSTAYAEMKGIVAPNEPRILGMSRVFAMMQKLRLFGAYCWLGRQVSEIPPESVAIADLAAPMCVLNPRDPDADYWICVDVFGIRFVSFNTSSMTLHQRGFLFNEDAMERILSWGAKKNIVQLQVQTISQM